MNILDETNIPNNFQSPANNYKMQEILTWEKNELTNDLNETQHMNIQHFWIDTIIWTLNNALSLIKNPDEILQIAKKEIESWNIIFDKNGHVIKALIERNGWKTESLLYQEMIKNWFSESQTLLTRLQTRTTNFKKRFGDRQGTDWSNVSKITDKNWEPLLLYHGIMGMNRAKWIKIDDIKKFNVKRPWKAQMYWVYFSPNRNRVKDRFTLSKEDNKIINAFLNIKNNFHIDEKDYDFRKLPFSNSYKAIYSMRAGILNKLWESTHRKNESWFEYNIFTKKEIPVYIWKEYPNRKWKRLYDPYTIFAGLREEYYHMFEKAGIDGLTYIDEDKKKSHEVMVFNDNQIKSAIWNNWDFNDSWFIYE